MDDIKKKNVAKEMGKLIESKMPGGLATVAVAQHAVSFQAMVQNPTTGSLDVYAMSLSWDELREFVVANGKLMPRSSAIVEGAIAGYADSQDK